MTAGATGALMAQAGEILSFGPFRLAVAERLLTRDGVPIELGVRALDGLVALVSRPNMAVAKRDLMAQIWPDVTVGEASLRFHIAILRKALGDGIGGARYITTLAGRGYCFVAPVTRTAAGDGHPAPGGSLLPPHLARMVGRAEDVRALSAALGISRLVTIVGPGGGGKTTVAVAVGHALAGTFAGAVVFIDLGALRDPAMIAIAVTAPLGIPTRSDDPLPSLLAYLRDKRLLLILDNCEHLIDSAASLAARILAAAPQVHILGTSREALRVEGERVHLLPPLACPAEDAALAMTKALAFPAVALFVERVAAGGVPLAPRDEDAAIIARICRRLDGMPLAIELAAGRVQAFGLQQTLAILDQRLTMLWLGQRSAPPRQHTLQATLDWSYGLLSLGERLVLRRLAVFAGSFSLEAACAVVVGATLGENQALAAIDSLVGKSMLSANPAGDAMRYRLLDTTRLYALGRQVEDAELPLLPARHAEHYRQWLKQIGTEWPSFATAAERAPHLANLANLRAALEWAFGPDGTTEIGLGLAAAAAPVFLAMSLLTECERWSSRALLALETQHRGGAEEMRLQASLGLALMFSRGNVDEARVAFHRSLAISEARGDALNRLRLLALLHTFHHRIGEFRLALHYARQGAAVPVSPADPGAIALARAPLGSALHHAGDLVGARQELEAVLRSGRGASRTGTLSLGFDHYVYASIALARTLWLQGHPAQALRQARQTVAEAAGLGHPVTLAIALAWALPVLLWAGELEEAEAEAGRFVAHAVSHSLTPYLAVGRGFMGELAIRRGDPRSGIAALRSCLDELQLARYGQVTVPFSLALAEGLAALDQPDDAIALLDVAIRMVEADGPITYLPELLRVKGKVLLSLPDPLREAAEVYCVTSLDCSRRHGARGWELRAAIDLAALRAAAGRSAEARALLGPVLAQFVEGFETADLQAARQLMKRIVQASL